jgi:2-oxoglutarate dehydrogenase E2 component (dihydrolipoamide succinyltransferase)
MYEVTVPKLNSNDVSYVLTEWYYADGDLVPPGAAVAAIETSKAAEELACDGGGVLQRQTAAMQECHPSEVIARLFRDETERQEFLAAVSTGPSLTAPVDFTITEPARRLIEEHGIDPAVLATIGRKVIGRADVEQLLDGQVIAEEPRSHVPTRGKRAVAEMVTTAHQTIPAAYAVVSIAVDAALQMLRRYSDRERITVRLPELLICTIGQLVVRYPLFFATIHNDGRATLATEARIGVTIDVGRGLSMPVISGSALDSLKVTGHP